MVCAMPRSLKIKPECIERIKSAVQRNCFPSQKALATELGLTRSTVSNFLNGKPVDYLNFVEISEKLGYGWQEIAAKPEDNLKQPDDNHSSPAAIYVERPPIEANCYQTIMQPGALLRVKAPQEMGKTRLMHRLLEYAREQGYKTVDLSFELADKTVFLDFQKFCQWFCVAVGDRLDKPNKLTDYWDEILAFNYNTTSYFQKYLLTETTQPLVLALDNVDLVFEHTAISTDFCNLLRSWHNQARTGDRNSRIWQKLSLVIVHATDIYGSLNINYSPLANVGLTITLPEFNAEQLQDLAQQNQLNCHATEVKQLMSLVGGQPYLAQLAFNRIKYDGFTLARILQEAHTEAGIYSNHLRQKLVNLQQFPELATAFMKVVTQENPVQLGSALVFKLQGMGLIKLDKDTAKVRCELYRRYFSTRLSSKD
ncbi:MAG: helix-turn-helix domain-containing protein [Symploca sp. SIO3E6]|nr:helix-turn-helix domain-containing protein [Caldora sp. SIO3E6]